MIHNALTIIKNKLEQNLINRFGLDERIVVINGLVEHDGQVPQKNQNKMVLTLINLEEETNKQFIGGQQKFSGSSAKINPAVVFNLVLLFTANFDDYEEALKFLNATITFFQANNSINTQNTPDLTDGISKLNFDIETANYREIHSLWSAMGAKYQPSIIYKVRSLVIQAGQLVTERAQIKGISSGVTP